MNPNKISVSLGSGIEWDRRIVLSRSPFPWPARRLANGCKNWGPQSQAGVVFLCCPALRVKPVTSALSLSPASSQVSPQL